MSEFNVSDTPERTALILTRGEVQDNHIANFGKILRYSQVVTVSTDAIEDLTPLVGMPLVYRGEYAQMQAKHQHEKDCANWTADYVTAQFGLERYRYDVHLLNGAPDVGDDSDPYNPEILRPHWQAVAQNVNQRESRFSRDGDGSTLLWQYSPFVLQDKQLEGFGQVESNDQPSVAELVEELQAARLPVRFRYARALLQQAAGDVEEAKVTFSYPTSALFKRTIRPDYDQKNSDGDRILTTMQITSRAYVPEISAQLKAQIVEANREGSRAVEKAIEQHGDELMYMMADDGTTEYNNEARMAPLYNLA